MKEIKQPHKVYLDNTKVWMINNDYPLYEHINIETIYYGMEVLVVDTNARKKTIVDFGRFQIDTLMFTHKHYNFPADKIAVKLSLAYTYQNFAAYKEKMLREFRYTESKRLKQNRFSENQINTMIYLNWLLIPLWAKNETEYNKKWGALAVEFPFTLEERHITTNYYN